MVVLTWDVQRIDLTLRDGERLAELTVTCTARATSSHITADFTAALAALPIVNTP